MKSKLVIAIGLIAVSTLAQADPPHLVDRKTGKYLGR